MGGGLQRPNRLSTGKSESRSHRSRSATPYKMKRVSCAMSAHCQKAVNARNGSQAGI